MQVTVFNLVLKKFTSISIFSDTKSMECELAELKVSLHEEVITTKYRFRRRTSSRHVSVMGIQSQ